MGQGHISQLPESATIFDDLNTVLDDEEDNVDEATNERTGHLQPGLHIPSVRIRTV